MSISNIIQEISKSGGWCEVSFHPKGAMNDKLLGRIAFHAKDFVVIQRFNMKGEFWDGYLIIHQEWVSKIKKANWIKRYLSVGGAVIEDIDCPEILQKHTWYDTMESCRTSREPINLVSEELNLFGYVNASTVETIQLQLIELKQINQIVIVQRDTVHYMQVKSKSINEVVSQYQRLLTQAL